MAITLAQADAQLTAWLAASTAVASKQSYEIDVNGTRRKLTYADAAEIRRMIEFWNAKAAQLATADAGGRRRTRYVVPE